MLSCLHNLLNFMLSNHPRHLRLELKNTLNIRLYLIILTYILIYKYYLININKI